MASTDLSDRQGGSDFPPSFPKGFYTNLFLTSLVALIKSRWLESFFVLLKGTRWHFVVQLLQNSKY